MLEKIGENSAAQTLTGYSFFLIINNPNILLTADASCASVISSTNTVFLAGACGNSPTEPIIKNVTPWKYQKNYNKILMLFRSC